MQYGYFDNEKREYVIDNVALPCSWTNYLGVEDMAAVINHTAGGYLFYKTPEYHRISRFRGNGVPMDRPGFYVYIRDNESRDYLEERRVENSLLFNTSKNIEIRKEIKENEIRFYNRKR